MRLSKLFLIILPNLIWVICLGAVIFLQDQKLAKIKSQEQLDYFKEEASLRVKLDLEKKVPSFGFQNLIADFNFLNFIQYFGDNPAREKTGHSLIPEFFEIIVNNDPRFVQAVLNLSSANSIYAGRPDITVSLMNRVLKSISPDISPLTPYLWVYKAVDEILFLGDLKAARNSYQIAAKLARIKGDNTTAKRLRESAAFLATNPDSKQTQIAAWITIFNSVPDKKTKQYALEKLKFLGADFLITREGILEIKPSK
jgi:hypothetical protein